ncbi:hypothetical protein Tco_1020413 [Tanacetum coccineum]
MSLLRKCTSTIRQLAYDIVPDFLDEYLQMSTKSSRLSLDHFCTSVMKIFGPEYLRKPTMTDVVKLYRYHKEKHGFSGYEGTLSLSKHEDNGWDFKWEGVFRVKDVRILLDECFLPKAPTATRWVKYVPIKNKGRFLALVLQLQIGYGYRQARMPLVESIMDAPLTPQLYENAGGLPRGETFHDSCSQAVGEHECNGSSIPIAFVRLWQEHDAMKVSNGGHLHFREVGE